MLNGKFYTGLTAKQINRCGNGKNRLESHFFWPDDTKAESAVETRLKRRASLQYEQMEKPRIERLNSVEECNADTKGLFHREFAKSSIQFYDNIEEQPDSGQQTSRIQAILKAKAARREIAPKPTATRLQLPEKVIDEEYTIAKKQQTYNSKIQFYDYVDEDLNNSNKSNKKRPDMNDKRELERNSKNSPKLQIKRNVSNFSDVDDVPEVKVRNDFGQTDSRDNKRAHADQVRNNVFQEEDDNRSDRSHKDFANTKQRIAYRNEERSPRSMKIRQNNNFSKYQNNNQQRWLRQSELNDPYYEDEYQPDINFIENNMRNVKIHSRPTKHVTYRDTYDDRMDDDFGYDGHQASNRSGMLGANASSPKQRPGSSQRQQQLRTKSPEYYDEITNTEEELQYMETCRRPIAKTNYNNNVNRPNNSNKSDNNNHNNNNSHIDNSDKNNINQKAQRQISPKMSTTTTAAPPATSTTAATVLESSEPTINSHKHLRSNIFLNDSALTSTTPTSKFRRNARNSAVGRVSVGLPD